MISANTDVVRYLFEHLADAGIHAAVVDESMTPDERIGASASASEAGMPMLVSDLALSGAVLAGIAALYHYDLPHSRAAFWRRMLAAQGRSRGYERDRSRRVDLTSTSLVWNVGSDQKWLGYLAGRA